MTKLLTRQTELKTKVDAVVSKIEGPTDVIKSKEAVDAARDMLLMVNASWKDCQEAEMPFLIGVEVLELEANTAAIDACKTGLRQLLLPSRLPGNTSSRSWEKAARM